MQILITCTLEHGRSIRIVEDGAAELSEHGLTKDEALGVVAAALYGPKELIPYLKTQAQHDAWEKARATYREQANDRREQDPIAHAREEFHNTPALL